MDVKINDACVSDELKSSIEGLAKKIDAAILTYDIKREDLFALVSDVLDGDIES